MKGKEKMEKNEMQEITNEIGHAENAPFRLKVKYNHEELLLPEDEAVMLAQKGLNYDKVLQSLNELKSDKGLMLLESLSKECGYDDRTKFLEDVAKMQNDSREKELLDFIKENPGIDVKKIPDSVIREYRLGKGLSESFFRYSSAQETERLNAEIERLNALLEIKTEETANELAANEAVGGSGSVSGEYYSDDELDALTDGELSRNLERAIKSMSRLSEKNK